MREAAITVSRMSSRPHPAAQRFAARLEQELARKGWGNRTLARAIAKDPKGHRQVENARKAVQQYLRAEINPSPTTRRKIAVALGLAPNALDDEEDLLSSLATLIARKQRLIRKTGDPYAMGSLK